MMKFSYMLVNSLKMIELENIDEYILYIELIYTIYVYKYVYMSTKTSVYRIYLEYKMK